MVFSSLRALALGLLGLCLSSVSFAQSGYSLELEVLATHTEGELAGMTTYGLFLNMVHPTDFLSSCSGDDNNPMVMSSSTGTWYNNAFNANWTAAGLNPLLFGAFPELAFDSFLTIGSANSDEGPFPQSVSSEVDFTAEFTGPGPGQNFVVDDGLGGAWFLTFPGLEAVDNHPAFAGDDLKVLVAQFTTDGEMSGQLQIQVFREGVQTNEYRELLPWCADVEACGLGCTDPMAANYDAEAVYNDGTCEYVTASEGCTDDLACNYDAEATLDDGSCEYAEEFFDCDGNCLADVDCNGTCGGDATEDALGVCGGDCAADADADGVCDDVDECVGDYDAVGVCNGGCALDDDGDGLCDDVDDCVGAYDALGVCNGGCALDEDADGICDDVDECVGALDACGVCNGPGAVFECGCTELPEGDCDCDGSQQDALGECGGGCFADADGDGICDDEDDCVGSLDALGVCNGDCEADADGNGICDDEEGGDVFGCTIEEACNYNPEATVDDGSCEFDSCVPDGFCCDPNSPNYDPVGCANLGDGFGDPDCVPDEVGGCTIEEACNYNPEATVDDGSCDFTSCLSFGCTDDTACNYDPEAQFNDGSCEYANFPYDCAGDCVNDDDGDGVCNEFEVPGCTDETACNYDEAATDDNGNCQYLDALGICGGDCQEDANANGVCDIFEVSGCTDANACNYVPLASLEDGSCLYPEANYDCDGFCLDDVDGDGVCDVYEVPGCTDLAASNYNPEATDDDGSCVYDVEGCTDETACNYNPEATVDDGACEYPEEFYGCDGNCLNDGDGDGVCDELEVVGCQDESACNYNAEATDEGECEYAEEFYDCDGNCLNDADGDGVCDELELAGCTDADACNYDDEATDDNASCEFPGDPCDDGNAATINDALNESCECEGEVEDGVEEATIAFDVYPSPVRDMLNLRLDGIVGSGDVEATILSSSGQVLRSERLAGCTQLDVSSLASGVYFLSLEAPSTAVVTRRFVVAGGE